MIRKDITPRSHYDVINIWTAQGGSGGEINDNDLYDTLVHLIGADQAAEEWRMACQVWDAMNDPQLAVEDRFPENSIGRALAYALVDRGHTWAAVDRAMDTVHNDGFWDAYIGPALDTLEAVIQDPKEERSGSADVA